MNALITAGTFLLVFAGAGFVFWRVTRRPGDESPKRRELKRARLRVVHAQHAMNDIEESLNRYRPVMDTVESALADEITTRISLYKNEILELDK